MCRAIGTSKLTKIMFESAQNNENCTEYWEEKVFYLFYIQKMKRNSRIGLQSPRKVENDKNPHFGKSGKSTENFGEQLKQQVSYFKIPKKYKKLSKRYLEPSEGLK